MSFEKKEQVFVYGTLKSGKANNDILGNSLYMGLAVTVCKYPLHVHHVTGLPVLFPNINQGHPVRGELYQCTSRTIDALDILEGVPRLYFRRRLRVAAKHGYEWPWVYFYAMDYGLYRQTYDDHSGPIREY